MTSAVPASSRYRRRCCIRLSSAKESETREKSRGSKRLYFRKIGRKIERFLALPGARARRIEPPEERFRDVPRPYGLIN